MIRVGSRLHESDHADASDDEEYDEYEEDQDDDDGDSQHLPASDSLEEAHDMILDLRRSVISHRNRANAKHARGDHDNKVSRRHELHEVRTLCAAKPCVCQCCRCSCLMVI